MPAVRDSTAEREPGGLFFYFRFIASVPAVRLLPLPSFGRSG